MDWNLLFPPDEPVIALPSWDRPKLLLSARTLVGRWRDSAFYPAHRSKARAWRIALRTYAASGMASIRLATGSRWVLGDFLKDIVDSPLPPAVQIGTKCAAHKWTMEIRQGNGKVAAYVKFGNNQPAFRRLSFEHQVLRNIPKGCGPKLLKFDSLGKGAGLCLSPATGQPIPTGTLPSDPGLMQFLESLTVQAPLPVDRHPAILRLQHNAPRAIARWIDCLSDRDWPVVFQHGDLAPWNVFAGEDGRLAAIDWEYGAVNGLAYLDIAYYALQIAALIDRLPADDAMKYAANLLSRGSWPALKLQQARAITALAAYDAWTKALADGDSPDEKLQQWQRLIWDREPGQNRASGKNQSVTPVTAAMPVAFIPNVTPGAGPILRPANNARQPREAAAASV
jgi:hypothetical protein